LEVQNLGSLWYERLGETYLALFEQKPAMDAFTEAIKLDHQNWRCFEGLANAFAEKDNLPSAISEMEKALELLREIKERDESEGNSFLGDLLLMADWHTELHQLERAIKYYQEATHVDPYKYEAHYKLFKTLVATSKEEDAQALLRDLHVNKSKDSPLSQLCAMFQPLISDYWACDLVFGMMFSTTQQTPLFNTILEDIDTAIELARNEKRISDLAALLLHKGIAVYYYDQSQTKAAESALELWEECGELISNIDLTFTAFRFISAHHFHQAIIPGRDPQIHLEKMQLIVKRRVSDFPDPHGKAYLGAYYVLSKDLTKAKKLLLEDFNSAMALLSDDVDYNDYQGYYSLAEILMRSGDDLNTLSAWSLLGPSDLDTPKDVLQFDDQKTQDIALELLSVVQSKVSPEASNREIFEALRKECQLQQQNRNSENPDDASRLGTLMEIEYHLAVNTPTYSDSGRRNGYLTNYCDGRVCGKRWDYADDFYCCKICPDVQFCEECRDNLKNGKLKRFICNKNHDWLHVPKWDDEEYMKIGKGNVRIGGEMKDGARVGGQGVPISEWLNLLRDEWGIPRIEKPNKKDETQAENTNLPGGQEDTEPQVQEEISKEADD
jgi:tetratricopeptide (TPR) repeat protein